MVVPNFFTFCVLTYRTPRGGKSQNTGFSGPFGLGQPLGRNSGPKTEKHDFPELGALLGGKTVRPISFSQQLRNFFTFCVLTDQTPGDGKLQNAGFLGPFGLGQPLGTQRKPHCPGGKQKNENSQIETEKRQTNPLQLGPNTKSWLGLQFRVTELKYVVP